MLCGFKRTWDPPSSPTVLTVSRSVLDLQSYYYNRLFLFCTYLDSNTRSYFTILLILLIYEFTVVAASACLYLPLRCFMLMITSYPSYPPLNRGFWPCPSSLYALNRDFLPCPSSLCTEPRFSTMLVVSMHTTRIWCRCLELLCHLMVALLLIVACVISRKLFFFPCTEHTINSSNIKTRGQVCVQICYHT